jgi:ankyrin repeat protein
LLAHGADPNARITTSAGVMGFVLLKRGAFDTYSIGTGDLKDATPLWVAAFSVHGQQIGFGGGPGERSAQVEVVRTLLKAGADPKLTTSDKTTSLMVAAGLGRGTYLPGKPRGDREPDAEEAVKVLIDAGGDVNAKNEAGFTALHGAAFKGLNEVAQILVEHGANLNAQDFLQRTPFRLAEGSKQTFQFQEWPETAALLRKLGADTTLGVPGRVQERQRELDKGESAK